MKKKFLILSLFIVYMAIYTHSFAQATDANSLSHDSINSINDTCTKIRIMCVGDIMTHFPQVSAAKVGKKGGYDFASQFEMVSPLLKEGDLVIGNLETVLAGDHFGFSGYPQFNGPQAIATCLKRSGFTLLTTANNHSFDQNLKGLKNTLHLLDSINILHTGTFANDSASEKSLIVSVKGIDIGVLSYTYGTNSILSDRLQKHINIIDSASILKEIEFLKKKNVAIIIASIHFGTEYSPQPSDEQKKIVNFLWQNSVAIVFGHHPHVLQPAIFDSLNNRYAIFSLGNFFSNQFGNNREFGGICDIIISNCLEKHVFRIEKALVHPTCVYHWNDTKRTRFNILLLNNLPVSKLYNSNPGYMMKLGDTIKYFDQFLHSLDGNFTYEPLQKSSSSDSCR